MAYDAEVDGETWRALFALVGTLGGVALGGWLTGRRSDSERWLTTKRELYARFLAEADEARYCAAILYTDNNMPVIDKALTALRALSISRQEITLMSPTLKGRASMFYRVIFMFAMDITAEARDEQKDAGWQDRPQTDVEFQKTYMDEFNAFTEVATRELRTHDRSLRTRWRRLRARLGRG